VTELRERLREIARVPVLLVASDYDGTLAPIVDDPSEARPLRESVVALRTLAGISGTHVAVVSGRAIRDLASLTGLPEEVHLVGSHGSEFDADFAVSLPDEAKARRDHVLEELREVARRHDGFHIEEKPASVAFHYRNAPEEEAQRAVREILGGAASLEGVYTKEGKQVVELTVIATDKGAALETIRQRVGASAVLFLGDDRTDEDAFTTLTGPDIGVKVGPGETRAEHRIDDPEAAAALLAELCELRCDWAAGAEAPSIESHAMLSDLRTTALVSPEGRVTWCCLPRIDAPAIFAELLGGPLAGRFGVKPVQESAPPRQRYLGDTLILETAWDRARVTDFLDCSGGRPDQRAGRVELVRIIEGEGPVEIEFAPRLDFGRVITRISARDGGVAVEDTHDPVVLHAPGVDWTIEPEGRHHTAKAIVDPSEGPVVLELRYGMGSLQPRPNHGRKRLEMTERFWRLWVDRLDPVECMPELVRRSALTLKGLVYGPTGAISAAATTSLPEHIGGVRNWDYRYCWLRDAAMSASALVKLGSLGEAMAYLDWVLHVVSHSESPETLMPLYTVTGETLGPEAEIGDLPGYRGSRPVRIGNAASRQVQIDVFGPIVALVHDLLARDAPLSSEHWRLVEQMVGAVERRWHEPDHGIWEIRKPMRHHVHSKVMCWMTVDRGLAVSRAFLDRDQPHWADLRERIRADVLERGWKEEAGAFTAAYDGNDLDAAALTIGLTGLLPPEDERFVRTVEKIEQELRVGPTVYRYRCDDGLPGFEGGFHLCAGWLVEAYLRIGRREDAEELFNAYTGLAGPTGLLSEQYGPRSGRALGNHPQAYSHLAMIENALLFCD